MNETKDLGVQLCYLQFDTLCSLDGKYFTPRISCSLLSSSFSISFSFNLFSSIFLSINFHLPSFFTSSSLRPLFFGFTLFSSYSTLSSSSYLPPPPLVLPLLSFSLFDTLTRTTVRQFTANSHTKTQDLLLTQINIVLTNVSRAEDWKPQCINSPIRLVGAAKGQRVSPRNFPCSFPILDI